MKQASEEILKTLRERGYRLTKARHEILAVISKAPAPFTVQDIATLSHSDEVSVYRTIRLLSSEQLLTEVAIGGERPRYELRKHHHHHAVCRSCGKVAHVEGGAEPKAPRRIPGFSSITGHELTFYGLCTACGKM